MITSPSNQRLLGMTVGAVITTMCIAQIRSCPHYESLERLAVNFALHPSTNDTNVECSWGSDKSSCQEQDDISLSREAERPAWAFFQAGVLFLFAIYSYCMNGDEENNEVEKITKRGATGFSKTSAPTNDKCLIREWAREQGLVLYDGNWYSVGRFAQHHPGGADILQQYLGTDISLVFRVMHRNYDEILKHRRPLRAATEEEARALTTRREEVCHAMIDDYRLAFGTTHSPATGRPFDVDAFERDAHELHKQFAKEGFFQPTLFWLLHKTALALWMLSLSVSTMKMSTAQSTVESSFSYILPGIFLGLFWHQSGFLMHDAEHHNLVQTDKFPDERFNDILGWLFGTVFVGVNGAWWREEHREHHAMLNSFDTEGSKDPQMREDIWIQHKDLIPFYGQELIHFLCNFQHILFLPMIFIAGRVGIVIDSTLTERKFRPWTILGNILHILLHYYILSQSSYPMHVYVVASFQQAILSLQLLGNHYTKPWNQIHCATEANFFVWQVLCTQDFACPTWARWYYGGLNFHYAHHLFPTLPREYFHLTTPRIKALCEKHGLPFIEVGFIDCLTEMVMNFNEVRKEFAKQGSGTLALMYT